jgi:hypothetical protein
MRVDAGRRLSQWCIALFALSSSFPIVASVTRVELRPGGLGYMDVGVAAMLVVAVAAVTAHGRPYIEDRDRLTAFRWTQRLLALIPLLLAGFFLAGDRVDWLVLVVGLAWRGWLFVQVTPSLAASLRARADRQPETAAGS